MDEQQILKELGKHESDIKHNKETIDNINKKLEDYISENNKRFSDIEGTVHNYELKMNDLGHQIKDLETSMSNKMDKMETSLTNTFKNFMHEMAIKTEEQNKQFQELKALTDKFQEEQQEELKDDRRRWKDIKFEAVGKIIIRVIEIGLSGSVIGVILSQFLK